MDGAKTMYHWADHGNIVSRLQSQTSTGCRLGDQRSALSIRQACGSNSEVLR